MTTHVGAGSRTGSPGGRYVPAYGSVDAALGYVLFYIVVDRATSTVVDVSTGVLPGVSPSLVRLGLAAFLWFVLVTTLLDQARHQLDALGTDSDGDDRSTRARTGPTEPQALASLVLLVVGGLVTAWTFDRAIDTVVSLIRIVAAFEFDAIVLGEVAVLIAFFVSFRMTTYAIDRLLVGGFRTMLVDDRRWDRRR